MEHPPEVTRSRVAASEEPLDRLTRWSLLSLATGPVVFFATAVLAGLFVTRSEDGTIFFLGVLAFVGIPAGVLGSVVGLALVVVGRLKRGRSRLQAACMVLHSMVLGFAAIAVTGLLL